MISFSNFCSADEISGVSTWLERLVLHLHQSGIPTSVLLHGIGKDAHKSAILQSLRAAGVPTAYATKPKYTEDGIKDTFRFLDKFRPRVFVPQCLEHFFYAANLLSKAGLPWIYTIHSDDPVYWASSEMVDLRQPLSHTVGVSEHICRLARQKAIVEQTTEIPCGVSLTERHSTFSSAPFRVVYCGRVVEEQKRASLVVTTMALACQQSPHLECRILGDGPARASCENIVREHGLSDRVKFLGRLSANQIDKELLDCQAILLMSDYEGLPVALLEAMARGVVPVARSIPSGIPELITHEKTGLLTSQDVADAANQIIKLSSNPALWTSCSSSARQLVIDSYSEKVCFGKWARLLNEMAERSWIKYPVGTLPRFDLPPVPDALYGRDVRKNRILDRVYRKILKVLAAYKSRP